MHDFKNVWIFSQISTDYNSAKKKKFVRNLFGMFYNSCMTISWNFFKKIGKDQLMPPACNEMEWVFGVHHIVLLKNFLLFSSYMPDNLLTPLQSSLERDGLCDWAASGRHLYSYCVIKMKLLLIIQVKEYLIPKSIFSSLREQRNDIPSPTPSWLWPSKVCPKNYLFSQRKIVTEVRSTPAYVLTG